MAMAKPWNPMADTDGNREFNNYQQGPGENVDDSHQSGAMKKSCYIKSEYRLCVKYVPQNMSTQDVQDLCSSYAKVIDFHTPLKTPFIFVSFETLNDMNRVWTELKECGIRAEIANHKTYNKNKNRPVSHLNMSLRPSQMDMKNQSSIKGPFTKQEQSTGEDQMQTVKSVDLPASVCTVAIKCLGSNLVFIRSLAPEDDIILDNIKTSAKNSPVLEKLPEPGDILISDFQNTGYCRVLVIKIINKNKILVAHVDFGNFEYKKLSELREFPNKAKNCPRYAIPVTLKGVKDFQPNKKIPSYLYSLVDIPGKGLKLKMIYIMGDVELIDLPTNDNRKQKILNMLKLEVPKDDDTPVMSGDVEMKLLPNGKHIPAYVLDTSLLTYGIISCILIGDVHKLEELKKRIKEYIKTTTETYTPREHEMCLVKYQNDGLWYRAECLGIAENGRNFEVLFIDYGNIAWTKIENIRKYPKEFTYPCFTSFCRINVADLPQKLNDKAVKRFSQLIPENQKLVFEKVEAVRNPEIGVNHVNIPSILIAVLEGENLI